MNSEAIFFKSLRDLELPGSIRLCSRRVWSSAYFTTASFTVACWIARSLVPQIKD